VQKVKARAINTTDGHAREWLKVNAP